MTTLRTVSLDKIGSVLYRMGLNKSVYVSTGPIEPKAGDLVVVRVLTDNASYNQLELPTGRLAKLIPGDVVAGALGERRALKGFVGNVPERLCEGDQLHLLNMGGVIGNCTGHHWSFSDPMKLELIGLVSNKEGQIANLSEGAIPPVNTLRCQIPLIMIAGSCMNSGKTVAATELIRYATRAGLKVAAGKLSGVAALRDTLNMGDHGAIKTASFLDCGLASTVGADKMATVAKTIISHLATFSPDLIVLELGDGILGEYSVEAILDDEEIKKATAALIFCASDYVGAWGGIELLKQRGLGVDVLSGSVTDSEMGKQYVEREFGLRAVNARKSGQDLLFAVREKISEGQFAD
jgi:hypothetical protein